MTNEFIPLCDHVILTCANKMIIVYFFQQSEIEQIEKSERVGGAQQHKRVTAAINKQIQQQTTKLEEVRLYMSNRSLSMQSSR